LEKFVASVRLCLKVSSGCLTLTWCTSEGTSWPLKLLGECSGPYSLCFPHCLCCLEAAPRWMLSDSWCIVKYSRSFGGGSAYWGSSYRSRRACRGPTASGVVDSVTSGWRSPDAGRPPSWPIWATLLVWWARYCSSYLWLLYEFRFWQFILFNF
jgi:hypothetical protein